MKDNSECASLRLGRKPRPEKVKDAQVVKGAALRASRKQNTSDGNNDALVVIPRRGIANPPHTGGLGK